VAVVYACALVVARAGTHPRGEAFLGGKGRCGRADFGNDLDRKSLLSCLVSGLRSCWLDPVAESSAFTNHSCGALLLRPFVDSRAPFFVSVIPIRYSAYASPKVGAGCVSSACPDLWRGSRAIAIPTPTGPQALKYRVVNPSDFCPFEYSALLLLVPRKMWPVLLPTGLPGCRVLLCIPCECGCSVPWPDSRRPLPLQSEGIREGSPRQGILPQFPAILKQVIHSSSVRNGIELLPGTGSCSDYCCLS
jgi:hypothetical protein